MERNSMSSIEASGRMTRSALSKKWSRMLLMAALETQHSKNRWEEVSGCLPQRTWGARESVWQVAVAPTDGKRVMDQHEGMMAKLARESQRQF